MNDRWIALIAALIYSTGLGRAKWTKIIENAFGLGLPTYDIFIYEEFPGSDTYSIKKCDLESGVRSGKTFNRNTEGFELIKSLYRIVKDSYSETDETYGILTDVSDALLPTVEKTAES